LEGCRWEGRKEKKKEKKVFLPFKKQKIKVKIDNASYL